MHIYVRSLIHVYIHAGVCTYTRTMHPAHTHTLIHNHSRLCRHEQVQQRSPEVLIESKIGQDSVGSYQYVQASSLEMSSTEPANGTAGKCQTCQRDYTVPMDKDTTTVLCCTSCAYAGNAVSASEDASRSYDAPDGQVHTSLYLDTRTTVYVNTFSCIHIHVCTCMYIYMHMHAHIRRQVESRTHTHTQQTYARLHTHHPHPCVLTASAPYSAAFWLCLVTLNYTHPYT